MKLPAIERSTMRNFRSDRESLISIALAVFLIVLAFASGYRATSDLTWPPYEHIERDASFAQSILDGHYGENP